MNHLNIMHLHSPESAVLSALIFNALIIVLLIPIAMKGVKFKGASTQTILMKNMLVYGLGGMIVPFIGIKLIDLIIQLFLKGGQNNADNKKKFRTSTDYVCFMRIYLLR